ncbi:hypothetical protein GDO81_022412 [Engystomops pustulosus]|uniref:Uncharacterized protein n=1 Tax=Engystomops pustulosus TaxID=76066 RepID=A0AAV6Z4F9_ENGPU|nr:hypothetical protein GDO81_022412 [Engystomops pustulosus]
MSPALTSSLFSFPPADMKSSPAETGPLSPKEEENMGVNKLPKEQPKKETEKDSGFSDSGSESLSSEDPPPATTASTAAATLDTGQTQAAYTPIYILQNVILKQPHLVLLQSSLRRHRRKVFPSSYLPILRSYPRIAPRLAPPIPASSKETDHAAPNSKGNKQTSPQLLEVSLRSLALLRRTRETQRSIRELNNHMRLYERALKGEKGGWERLRKAMERSGGYRKIPPAIAMGEVEEGSSAEEASITSTAISSEQAEHPETHTEAAGILSGKSETETCDSDPGASV